MRRPIIAALICGSALSGCVAGPPPVIATPAPVLPDQFAFEPEGAADADLATLMPVDDAAFEALSASALAQSPTLAQALARIDQARAAANRAGADRLPTLGVTTSVTGTRTNSDQFGSNLPGGINFDTERVSYGSNIVAAWDADLFGRLRAQQRAAQARLDAANFAAHGVRIALLSEIAGNVIDWQSLILRHDVLTRDVDAARAFARLTADRRTAGLASAFDMVRADAFAAAAQTRLAALPAERARIVGRLVTLTASDAAAVQSALALARPPSAPLAAPTATPSTLLRNRPDVAAAEANLRAADADLAAAARRRFPTLSLSGTLGLLAFALGDVFDADALVGSLGASVAAPLLDFGRIAADIDGAASGKQAAFAAYRGAVYAALGETEAGYGLVAATDAEAALANAEATSLQRAASLADIRHRAGLASLLSVLDARRQAEAAGERAIAAAARARRARVALWLALGGER